MHSILHIAYASVHTLYSKCSQRIRRHTQVPLACASVDTLYSTCCLRIYSTHSNAVRSLRRYIIAACASADVPEVYAFVDTLYSILSLCISRNIL